MSEKTAPEIENVPDEITEGEKDYVAHTKKLAKDKRVRTIAFAAALVGAVALSLKYISTPTSEDENETNDQTEA